MLKKKASSGGKAEASGGNYETLVGAWYAHAVLIGGVLYPPFDLPSDTRFVSFGCTTDAPVDDVNTVTSDGGIVFVQAKRTLNLSHAAGSPLASALDQFVRQYQESQRNDLAHVWSRPLNSARDRLVLVTRSASSAAITELLPRLLSGLRDRSGIGSLLKVATSEAERRVAKVVEAILKRSWKSAFGKTPTPAELDSLLRLIWIQELDLEAGKRDRRHILEQFRGNLLEQPTQSSAAFSELYKLVARLRADRSGADRTSLLQTLSRAGVKLTALPDYRADVAALRKWTAARLESAPKFTRLLEDDPALTIERAAWPEFRAAAEAKSFLLVGEPGAGKSGLTYRLGTDALSAHRDVVFLPVDFLNVETFSALQAELGITHPLDEVLANWPGATAGTLIVDALDAARKPETQKLLREVIARIQHDPNSRWSAVVSVRKYDLRQGTEWARMFRGQPLSAGHIDPEFRSVAHVCVSRLTDAEIQQLAFPELRALFDAATDKLRDLLRNIFNLHLLADLLRSGVTGESLNAITTQSELLDSYWHHRIRGTDGKHDARELALSVIASDMIAAQSLSIMRANVRPRVNTNALVALEKEGILRADEQLGRPNEDVLLFNHHVLFDYTVARLVFARGRDPSGLIASLRAQRELVLMLSPSLTLAISDAWASPGARVPFWMLAFALAGAEGLPAVAQLSAPMIAAEHATRIEDFDPLLTALGEAELAKSAAENFVQNLVGALFVRMRAGVPFVGEGAGPWMTLCERLASIGSDKMIFAARALVATAVEAL